MKILNIIENYIIYGICKEELIEKHVPHDQYTQLFELGLLSLSLERHNYLSLSGIFFNKDLKDKF